MKRGILTVLCLCSFLCSKSQTLKVKSVEELTNDISARVTLRVDNNNNPCAIVRVNLQTLDNLKFSEGVVGDIAYMPGEYTLYVEDGLSALPFYCKDDKIVINFAEYGISSLEGKKSYRVILEGRDKERSPNAKSAYITANYDNIIVLIDGIPMGETPLYIESITTGHHTISVPNTLGYTMDDMVIDIKENTDNRIELNLRKEPRKLFALEYDGGTGEGYDLMQVYGVRRVNQNGKEGLVDYLGETIVPCIFDKVYSTKCFGNCYLVRQNGRSGVYEPGKGLVLPCEYSAIHAGETYLELCKNGKWGVIDNNKRVIVPMDYDKIKDIGTHLIVVKNEDQWGLYDINGNVVLNLTSKYKEIGWETFGYYAFIDDKNRSGFLDEKGQELLLPESDKYKFKENDLTRVVHQNGLFCVEDKTTGKKGVMNTRLEWIIPPVLDENTRISLDHDYELIELNHNNTSSLYDITGNNVFTYTSDDYTDVRRIADGFLCAKKNNEWGIIDMSGNIVKPFEYKSVYQTTYQSKQIVIVEGETYIQILDMNLDELTTLEHLEGDVYLRFWDDYIQVLIDNAYGYINLEGQVLANCIYERRFDVSQYEDVQDLTLLDLLYPYQLYLDDITFQHPVSEGLAVLNCAGHFGYINCSGKVVVPLIYTAITPFEDGVAFGRRQDGTWEKIYRANL